MTIGPTRCKRAVPVCRNCHQQKVGCDDVHLTKTPYAQVCTGWRDLRGQGNDILRVRCGRLADPDRGRPSLLGTMPLFAGCVKILPEKACLQGTDEYLEAISTEQEVSMTPISERTAKMRYLINARAAAAAAGSVARGITAAQCQGLFLSV